MLNFGNPGYAREWCSVLGSSQRVWSSIYWFYMPLKVSNVNNTVKLFCPNVGQPSTFWLTLCCFAVVVVVVWCSGFEPSLRGLVIYSFFLSYDWHLAAISLAGCCCGSTQFSPPTSGVVQQLRGPILPNFDHLPPSSGQLRTFYILPTFCSCD